MNEWYWGFHLLAAFTGFLVLQRWSKQFRCNVMSAIVAAILWVAVVYGVYHIGAQIVGITPGVTSTTLKFSPKVLLSFGLLMAAHPIASFTTFLTGQYLIPGFKMMRLVEIWLCSVLLTAWVLLVSMLANLALFLLLGLGCLCWSFYAKPRRSYY